MRRAAFVPVLGEAVVDLLAPRRGERILDLGCGDGALTERLVAAGAVVQGVDLSPELVSVALRRGLSVRLGDGQRLAEVGAYDAVFSNAALHWMREAGAVVDGVFRALRPGGRFVGEFGGAGNVGTVVAAMRRVFEERGDLGEWVNPWYFPTAKEYRAALVAGGFVVREVGCFARPTMVEAGLVSWLENFAGGIVDEVDEGRRRAFYRRVEALCRPVLYSEERGWVLDYVRLRFFAVRPD